MSLPSPWRADFPAFSAFAAEGLTYLDSAATAQKPQAVLDALNGYYLGGAANVHRAQHVPGGNSQKGFPGGRGNGTHLDGTSRGGGRCPCGSRAGNLAC